MTAAVEDVVELGDGIAAFDADWHDAWVRADHMVM